MSTNQLVVKGSGLYPHKPAKAAFVIYSKNLVWTKYLKCSVLREEVKIW